MSVLEVTDLRVTFQTIHGVVCAVDGLSFSLDRGQTLGIVGESGSGKSVASLAIMGLHRDATVAGSVLLDGTEIIGASQRTIRQLRGRKVAMIFQDPLSSLHPAYTVGEQIAEAYRLHFGAGRRAARERAAELLDHVGIPDPHRRQADYPHQFSGGMRQRVMIAMALSCEPEVLIADEPTTALDVTVQAQILDLIVGIQQEFGLAVLMITHDLGVVARMADKVMIMYAGRAVEEGPAPTVFETPKHPYTRALLNSIPHLDRPLAEALRPVAGSPPSLMSPPPGCRFHPRCGERTTGLPCDTRSPRLANVGDGHRAGCHLLEVTG
ncbi:peptide ABC transporter ATP-binding protein [Micromonospora tulbaghiae]|uniref:Peptide ABC transporter ATP-binding protein n=1 Tax=Micromonospora tulbaghiae TaxID=479978 RepID=A0A386WHC5_9ACTN|nr:ABC transporter ATP-binding protein [Micromonospora tulbaghiae]AYF26889.1 peptide ABC transporter ATP-binding protein [Micromonospora tulbaghiae]NED56474.1 ABC transporter ATP-binding protein [Micromonospora aurantiaca]